MSAEQDPRHPIDARVDTPQREGLTGTAPTSLYRPIVDADEITRAPDGKPLGEQPKWRRDFPIDTPQDLYVARRDFMKFMVLTSLAFTVGQFWIAAQNWLRRRRGAPELKKIASLVGDSRRRRDDVSLSRSPPIAAFWFVRLRMCVVAFSQQCTHLSCAVVPQPEQNRLFCPCHEGAFDLQSGRPIAGPPNRPLTRVLLDVRGDDIYASGIELRTV